jgi:hypothetical protein
MLPPLMASRSFASPLVFPLSFFLQKVLGEDVKHANLFPSLGDVQAAFGIFF